MAPVRRHVSVLLRIATALMLLLDALGGTRVYAQVGPMAGTPQGMPAQGATSAPGMPTGPVKAPEIHSPIIPTETVLDIRIVGNRSISREKVLANMGTRIDRPFDQATFERDVRKLAGKNWFVDVQPRREKVANGVIITLEVVERPTLEYVKFLGNKKIKVHTLAKEVNLKKGDSLDPFAVEEGQRKIETLYQTKGFNDVKISILEGTKPTDRGAVYVINEGQTQKIWKVKFEGNTIASDGRLKTQIQSKPPILWVFKGQVDRKKIEEDVEKLTNYYRSLGFFKANVAREYEFNEKENWMTLTFYINEGPRYHVRNISFIGNRIYDEAAISGGLKLKAGEFYDQAKMNTDIGYVKDMYGSNGYVFANAEADLRFFEEPGQLDLVYKVTEGKQCLVGDINVHIGGDSPHTKAVTAINRLSLRPGDVIDIRKIRASERRIKYSGLFNNDPTKGDVPRIVLSPPDSEDEPADGQTPRKKKRGIGARRATPTRSVARAPTTSLLRPECHRRPRADKARWHSRSAQHRRSARPNGNQRRPRKRPLRQCPRHQHCGAVARKCVAKARIPRTAVTAGRPSTPCPLGRSRMPSINCPAAPARSRRSTERRRRAASIRPATRRQPIPHTEPREAMYSRAPRRRRAGHSTPCRRPPASWRSGRRFPWIST